MRKSIKATLDTRRYEIMPENRNDEADFEFAGILTAEEVANLLQIHVQSVYQMKARNEIPYRSAGKRRVRFLWREIQFWLDTGELPESFLKRELSEILRGAGK